MDDIIRSYHLLTGTQPVPARWVFGNLMSRFGYRSESQLMETVNKMKEQRVPVDAVILDLFWFGDSIKGTMGNLDWVNKNAWPAPKEMISNLQKQGIKTILITEPFVLNTTPAYESSKKFHATDSSGNPFLLTDFYFGNGGLLDIFRKDAQDWFWSKYKKQIDNGVEGWWGDLGEPERHPANVYHSLKDLGFKRLFKADEVHNIFGHYWDKMLFEKYAKEYPATRLFNLNRSGYAGSPRYGVFPWSGDVSRSWSGLQAQLPLMIGMSMSGVPYIHADAGGFAGGDGDTELYTRWIQFAVFTPVFRPHGTALGDLVKDVKDIPSEAALYDEPVRSIARKYIRLRYQLLPYNYTLGYEQAKNGKPLVKPLFFYDNRDTNLYRSENEFMWGDHILVAPVLEKGAARRLLYLPAGNWYNLFSGNISPGALWINEKVELDDIPVFVKEGSFIPMFIDSMVRNTADYTGKKLTIKYYPSVNRSNYTFFDDDGHTNNSLSNGKYELIRFEGQATGKNINIRIAPANKYVMFAREFKIELPAGIKMVSAMVNNKSAEVYNNTVLVRYDGKPLVIAIRK
ncbi:MAG TPA: TIM-barrel domain-containing protein, partial [Ferruginibacter sp.]|nr:TIM-barrel domain-containing protein [Ferruginibacter sp.]